MKIDVACSSNSSLMMVSWVKTSLADSNRWKRKSLKSSLQWLEGESKETWKSTIGDERDNTEKAVLEEKNENVATKFPDVAEREREREGQQLYLGWSAKDGAVVSKITHKS